MLCAVPSRLPKMRGEKNIKDAGREASCLPYTSPRRAGTGRRSVLVFVRAPAFAREGLSVFAGTHESTQVRMEG